jgi:hypothetical protein
MNRKTANLISETPAENLGVKAFKVMVSKQWYGVIGINDSDGNMKTPLFKSKDNFKTEEEATNRMNELIVEVKGMGI